MRLISILIVVLAWAGDVRCEQRQLVTEDTETVGAGRVLIEAGLDYGRDVTFPASGLNGNLLRFPLIGFSVGVSSIAELQIDGGLYNRLSISERRPAPLAFMAVDPPGAQTSEVEDIGGGSKNRLVAGGVARAAFGVEVPTKVPEG